MSVLESVHGALWARGRQPDDVMYLVALAHERFPPEELLGEAMEAEKAGFPPGSGNAWVWPGAVRG